METASLGVYGIVVKLGQPVAHLGVFVMKHLPTRLFLPWFLACTALLVVLGVPVAEGQGLGGPWCLHQGPWLNWYGEEGEDGEACDEGDGCEAPMLGAEVVPPVDTDATGNLAFSYIWGCGDYFMSVAHTVEDAIAVELRVGGPGENGPLFISKPVNTVFPQTTIGEEDFCPAPRGELYVVVTSAAYPDGEVRAQLCLDDLICPSTNPRQIYSGPHLANELVPASPVAVTSFAPCTEVRERPVLLRKRESVPWLEGGPWLAGWLEDGLHLARSLDDGASWGASEEVASGVTAPVAALGEEEDRLLDFGFIPDESCGEGECPPSGGTLFSVDAGENWSEGDPLRGPASIGPTRVFYECFDSWTAFGTREEDGIFVARSVDNGLSWSEEQIIDTSAWGTAPMLHDVAHDVVGKWVAIAQVTRDDGAGGFVDALVVLRSGDHRATWSGDLFYEHSISLGAELPQAALATTEKGRWAVVWGVREPGDPEVRQLLTARSVDNGATWTAPHKIADDAPAAPAFASNFQRVWLVVWSGNDGSAGLFDDLFYAIGFDTGETWSAPRRVLTDTAIDRARVAPVLQLDGPDKGMVAWIERTGAGCDASVHSLRFNLIDGDEVGGPEAPELDLGTTAAALLARYTPFEGGAIGSLPWETLAEWFGALASGDGGPAALFDLIDANGNSTLSVPELRAVAGARSPVHAADRNADRQVGLSELLRGIQFYNVGGYHCAENPNDTEDGYAPGAGNTDCYPHSSDYAPQNWSISLSEILRLIQFFNSAGYTHCPELATEDGFCPVL